MGPFLTVAPLKGKRWRPNMEGSELLVLYTYKKSEDRGEDGKRTTDLRVYPHQQSVSPIIHAVRASLCLSECPVAQNYYTKVTQTQAPKGCSATHVALSQQPAYWPYMCIYRSDRARKSRSATARAT